MANAPLIFSLSFFQSRRMTILLSFGKGVRVSRVNCFDVSSRHITGRAGSRGCLPVIAATKSASITQLIFMRFKFVFFEDDCNNLVPTTAALGISLRRFRTVLPLPLHQRLETRNSSCVTMRHPTLHRQAGDGCGEPLAGLQCLGNSLIRPTWSALRYISFKQYPRFKSRIYRAFTAVDHPI